MKISLSNLWRWDGTVGRGYYCASGLLFFVLKYNLDRLLSAAMLDRPWTLFDRDQAWLYLWQTLPPPEHRPYFFALLTLSLPFLWAGVVLTLRRLRDIGWRPWWVALFFVPVLKLVFFAYLCVMPSHQRRALPPIQGGQSGWMGAFIPRSAFGSAAVALLISLASALSSVWLGTELLKNYGWALFVGLPFLTPMLAVLLYSVHERRSLGQCLLLANGVIALAGAGLLLLALEGVLCLIMAAPLAFAVASCAGLVGYYIQKTLWWPDDSERLFCMVLLAMPALMVVEYALPAPLPLIAVKSSVVVNAPPETVWRHVVSFSELSPPREVIFRCGIAYPVRAEIFGHGPGAVRHCNFSTGPFVEPIEVWDEPRLLKFSVTHNPAPLQEWTPYRHIHPPHLDNHLQSKAGQFHLVPLDGGRTLLEGTTWYYHRLWPDRYWRVWSDFIIHKIHLRVLSHVKKLSEEE